MLHGERIEALEISTFGLGSGDLMELDYSKESGYEMHAMLDNFGVGLHANSDDAEMSNGDILECDQSCMEDNDTHFTKLWEDTKKELYPRCFKYSKLFFSVMLLHIRMKNNWSLNSFNEVLWFYMDSLPNGEMLPMSFCEANKLKKGVRFTSN